MKELVYHRYLLPAVERFHAKTAVIDGPVTSTYTEHLDRVCRLVDAMRSELGVGPGDRFAVMALNGREYLELYHASFLSGSVVNPLNLRLAPKELEFILSDSGCKVCFVDAWFGGLIDSVGRKAGLGEGVVLIGDGDAPHHLRYEDLIGAGEPSIPAEPEEDDPAILMYTGGTTGLPKGVVIDNRALMLDMYKVATRWAMSEDYVYTPSDPDVPRRLVGRHPRRPRSERITTSVPLFRAGGGNGRRRGPPGHHDRDGARP